MFCNRFIVAQVIYWISHERANITEQNITALHMKGFLFIINTVQFDLLGKATFDNCSFTVTFLYIILLERKLELKPSNENMTWVNLHIKQYRIEILRTQIRLITNERSMSKFIIAAEDVIRSIVIEKSDIVGAGVHGGIRLSNFCSKEICATMILNVHIEHSTLTDGYIYLYYFEKMSQSNLVFVTCRNVFFYRSNILYTPLASTQAVGFHLENCIFYSAIKISNIVYISFQNCTFNHVPRLYRTSLSLQGLKQNEPIISTFHTVFRVDIDHPTVMLEDSEFYPNLSITETGTAIHCTDLKLEISDCVFILPEYSNLLDLTGYIHSNIPNFKATNVTLDALAIKQPVLFIFVSNIDIDIKYRYKFRVDNITILCAPMFKPVHTMDKSLIISCESTCSDGYTFMPSRMTLYRYQALLYSYQNHLYSPVRYLDQSLIPHCYPCPVGAACDPPKTPNSLPNYWGYRNQSGYLTLIRCPPDYCCTGNDTCEGIDSCKTGRTGTLCGTCKSNLTEALFSVKCLSFENCRDTLIVVMYLLCVLGYSIMLLVSETIKNKITEAFKKMSKIWKQRCHCKKRQDFSDNVQQLVEIFNKAGKVMYDGEAKSNRSLSADETSNQIAVNDASDSKTPKQDKESDSGMKYIQILFYYVQDATLFKVHLPVDGQQSESIVVKILEFSPEVLVAIYVKTVDLCFSSGLTSVTKVLAKSVFGYCVMLFIFLIYLVQKSISRFACKQSEFWVTLRSRLIQAFIMTVLFSLQKLVIGVFSLVQCVQIIDKSVLYIEGDIECYTWWQNVIQVYICINVIPLLFIVSHAPFYVQDKTMSVRMFILNCILPLPAFLYFITNRLIEAKRRTNLKSFTLPALVHFAAVKFLRKGKKVSGMEQETAMIQQTASQAYCGPEDIDIPFIEAEESNISSNENSIRHRTRLEDSVGGSSDENLVQLRIGNSKGVQTTAVHNVCDRCLGDIHTRRCFQDNEMQTFSQIETNDKRDASVQCTELEAQSSKVSVTIEHSKNEEAILHTLLKHNKCLQVHGIRFTWLGIHQAYRVILVVCNTYITEPLPRLWAMTTALMLISVANTFMKPYQDDKANKTAILSYVANLCIAMINIGRTFLATFSCKTNCSVVDTLLWYFSSCEEILLIYLPVGTFVMWVIYIGVQKSRSKDKSE